MKSKNPYFSVIIPALNEEKYLPKLLKDLTGQTYENFELIVVDGHSEDNTVNLTKKHTKLKPIIVYSNTRHVSVQRNLGAKKAKSDWLIFLDADTNIPNYFLEGIKYQITRKQPDCFTTFVKPDTSNSADQAIITIANLGIYTSTMLAKPQAYGGTLGIKKSIFNEIHGFDESLAFREDFDLVQKVVSANHKFKIFTDPQSTFSLRRLRKEGTLALSRKIAKIQLNYLFNFPNISENDYPMLGGKAYDQVSNKQSDFDLKILDKFKKLTKVQKAKLKTILDYFTNLDS